MHEIERTTNYRFQYQKLPTRFRRFVDEAIDIIKEFPMDFQNKITHIGNRKDGRIFRFRMPGCYLVYVVVEHEENAPFTIILTQIRLL